MKSGLGAVIIDVTEPKYVPILNRKSVVRTCAHVAGPVAFRMLETTEEIYFELALVSAFWTGVGSEIAEAYHNGHMAALGIQSRYVVIHDVLRNKSAAVAEPGSRRPCGQRGSPCGLSRTPHGTLQSVSA